MSRVETEVAVIGGGIAGCSTALHISLRGVPVVLLEKRQAGAAASGVNFGGVRRNGRALAELELAAPAGELLELHAEVEAVARCVLDGAVPPCTGEDGRWSTLLCLAAQASIDSGAVCDLGEFAAAGTA